MSMPDGRTIFDIITSGYTRTVIETGSGTLGANIPKDIVEKKGIQKGDEVVIREPDDSDHVVELHFKRNDDE